MSTAAPHRAESPTLTAEDEQELRRVVAEEVAAAGCPLISLIISPAIVGSVLARHGSPEQKDRWLRGIGAGTAKIAFAMTEPDAGLNSHRIATNARLDGDRFLLTGSKVFISALDEVEAVLVVARTGTVEGSGKALLSLFVVDTDSPGLTWQPMAMGLEMPESQNVVFFDDVEVGADRLVGERDRGLGAVFAGLNPERVIIASTSTGIGRYALAKATRYAKERNVWGRPIGSHQGIAHPLAEATMHLEGHRGARRQRLRPRGRPHRHAHPGPAVQDRARQPGDYPQLRRRAHPGPPEVILSRRAGWRNGHAAPACRSCSCR